MKDKMERRTERKREREGIMESRNSIHKSIEIWNKTICIVSSFSMAREEKLTRGSGTRQNRKFGWTMTLQESETMYKAFVKYTFHSYQKISF